MSQKPPEKKIQKSLGTRFLTASRGHAIDDSERVAIGDAIVHSFKGAIFYYMRQDDGSDLVRSIHSPNLRQAAGFAARGARLSYLFGRVSLLGYHYRRHIVRTQIMEYGSVCEAILLDLVQAVGKHNLPAGKRPSTCLYKSNKHPKRTIDWQGDGLFTVAQNNPRALHHRFQFWWLNDLCFKFGVYNSTLRDDITALREARNLVHPVIPVNDRYRANLDDAKKARDVVVRARDAALAFKQAHGLPIPQ